MIEMSRKKADKDYALSLKLKEGKVKHQVFEQVGNLIRNVNNGTDISEPIEGITIYSTWVSFCELIHSFIIDFPNEEKTFIFDPPNFKDGISDDEISRVYSILSELEILLKEYYGIILPQFIQITLNIKGSVEDFSAVKVGYYAVGVDRTKNPSESNLPDSRWA